MSTAQTIADAFRRAIAEDLGTDIAAEIDERNATPEYADGCCATHDFCDANMVMAEAFEAVTGRGPDVSSAEDTNLWNAAWDIARTQGFNIG